MKTKHKRQKLVNNAYLNQDVQNQSQHLSASTLLYKMNRLNNSMYSPDQTFEIHDYQSQNKKLKQQIAQLKQLYQLKQTQLNKQIQQLKQNLTEKQRKIQTLEQKIIQIQTSNQKKNQSLKDKLIECQDIVKQLEQKQMNSNAHNMLQTSRIQKLTILDQSNPINSMEDNPPITFNINNEFNLENQSIKPNMYVNPANLQKSQFLRNNQLQNRNVLMDNNRNYQESTHKRRNSPQVIFRLTPAKNIQYKIPYLPVPLDLRVCNNSQLIKIQKIKRQNMFQNKQTVYYPLNVNNSQNQVRQYISAQNKSSNNLNIRPNSMLINNNSIIKS